MKVKELIQKLSELDQEAYVCVWADHGQSSMPLEFITTTYFCNHGENFLEPEWDEEGENVVEEGNTLYIELGGVC